MSSPLYEAKQAQYIRLAACHIPEKDYAALAGQSKEAVVAFSEILVIDPKDSGVYLTFTSTSEDRAEDGTHAYRERFQILEAIKHGFHPATILLLLEAYDRGFDGFRFDVDEPVMIGLPVFEGDQLVAGGP